MPLSFYTSSPNWDETTTVIVSKILTATKVLDEIKRLGYRGHVVFSNCVIAFLIPYNPHVYRPPFVLFTQDDDVDHRFMDYQIPAGVSVVFDKCSFIASGTSEDQTRPIAA